MSAHAIASSTPLRPTFECGLFPLSIEIPFRRGQAPLPPPHDSGDEARAPSFQSSNPGNDPAADTDTAPWTIDSVQVAKSSSSIVTGDGLSSRSAWMARVSDRAMGIK